MKKSIALTATKDACGMRLWFSESGVSFGVRAPGIWDVADRPLAECRSLVEFLTSDFYYEYSDFYYQVTSFPRKWEFLFPLQSMEALRNGEYLEIEIEFMFRNPAIDNELNAE